MTLRKSPRLIVILLTLVGLLLAGWMWITRPPNDITLANGARLKWASCWFMNVRLTTVHCAHFYPAPSGMQETVRMPVVVIRERPWAYDDRPVLYISGGPGQSSFLEAKEIPSWLQWVKDVDWGHDIVLFDQQGTGMSTPKISCPEFINSYRSALGEDLTLEEEYSRGLAVARRCHEALTAGGKLPMISTRKNAENIRDLMTTLGDVHWNLYGVSYGTRVAMTVMREFPERVRSVVLDSIYPPHVDGLLTWPWVVNSAFERLFQACERSCDVLTDLRRSFSLALAALQRSPAEFRVPNSSGEGDIKVVINNHRFMNAVFLGMYDWQIIEYLPYYITSAAIGQNDRLKPLVEYYVEFLLDDSLNDVVYHSVECHDGARHERKVYLAETKKYPLVERYVGYDWGNDVCRFWVDIHAPDSFRQPVRSDIPTLILSGEFDPITPVEWANGAVRYLPRSYHVSIPGIGHGVVGNDACSSGVVRLFLLSPEETPDAKCLADLSPVYFRYRAKKSKIKR